MKRYEMDLSINVQYHFSMTDFSVLQKEMRGDSNERASLQKVVSKWSEGKPLGFRMYEG